jgi:hypothetical protein
MAELITAENGNYIVFGTTNENNNLAHFTDHMTSCVMLLRRRYDSGQSPWSIPPNAQSSPIQSSKNA